MTSEEGREKLEGQSIKISPFMQIPCLNLAEFPHPTMRLIISIPWREKLLQGVDVHGQLVSPGWKTHIKNAFEVHLGFPPGVYWTFSQVPERICPLKANTRIKLVRNNSQTHRCDRWHCMDICWNNIQLPSSTFTLRPPELYVFLCQSRSMKRKMWGLETQS